MDHIGQQTPQATFLNLEAHKLHREFEVADDVEIKLGQPVKLTDEGKVTPLLAEDSAHLSIGVSVHQKTSLYKNVVGQKFNVTVAMKAYAVITAEATGELEAGPVKYSGYNDTSKRNQYVAAADAATTQAYNLTPADAAGDIIEVAIL